MNQVKPQTKEFWEQKGIYFISTVQQLSIYTACTEKRLQLTNWVIYFFPPLSKQPSFLNTGRRDFYYSPNWATFTSTSTLKPSLEEVDTIKQHFRADGDKWGGVKKTKQKQNIKIKKWGVVLGNKGYIHGQNLKKLGDGVSQSVLQRYALKNEKCSETEGHSSRSFWGGSLRLNPI